MNLKFIRPENILRKKQFSPEHWVGESVTFLSSLFRWLIITTEKSVPLSCQGLQLCVSPPEQSFSFSSIFSVQCYTSERGTKTDDRRINNTADEKVLQGKLVDVRMRPPRLTRVLQGMCDFNFSCSTGVHSITPMLKYLQDQALCVSTEVQFGGMLDGVQRLLKTVH